MRLPTPWLLVIALVVLGLAGLGVALARGTTASPLAQEPTATPTPTPPAAATATPQPTPTPPVAATATPVAGVAGPAGPPVYSAKFLCGLQADGSVPVDPSKPQSALLHEPPVKPGNYATEINVHNPQETAVNFKKKAVLTGFTGRGLVSPPEHPFPPGELHNVTLERDFALEIDCPDIAELLGPTLPSGATFIKGFVVILASQELDVVGVYTSERVDERKNVECLLANGRVVEATLQADGSRQCPSATKSIGVGQGTGTGMSMDVEYITPKRAPPPTPTPTPTPTATPIP